jgi:oxygen-independent coproporphyrinogen-3 oxidase
VAGIYLHIPFCHRRCHYCDFYTHVNLSHLPAFFKSLLTEIELRKTFFLEKESIQTIYFGGGTPSILHPEAIGQIIEKISTCFDIAKNCEITLEVNPEDVSETYYRQVASVGVNRVSIGIQSFDDKILRYLNRRHGYVQAIRSIEWAFGAGFENVTIDLIYGIPVMDIKQWIETIFVATNFPIKHISAYHLTVEPRTTFGYLKEKGKLNEITEDESWEQIFMLHNLLKGHGFEHYEISNFAQPGFRSRHNQSYWQHKPYLGLGPAAHSFNGLVRYENVRDIHKYIKAIQEGRPDILEDHLTLIDRMNEEIMLQLRCIEGLGKKAFSEQFGEEKYQQLEKRALKYYPQYLEITPDGIILNLNGWFISDRIMADLFFS